MEKTSSGLHLPDELYKRILQLLHDIKVEIDQYRQDDVHVLRAYLYEALMLLNRAYQNLISMEEGNKEAGGTHISKFIEFLPLFLLCRFSVVSLSLSHSITIKIIIK